MKSHPSLTRISNACVAFCHRRLKLSTQPRNTTRLALEVNEAIDSDSLCGPTSDRAKHFIGIEYEIVLERGLKNLG